MLPSCGECGTQMELIAGPDARPDVRTFVCASCGHISFSGEAAVAAEPAASVDRIVPEGGSIDAKCPLCAVGLHKGKLDGLPALYCETCLGVLISNQNFGQLVRQRRGDRPKSDSIP